MWQRADPEDQLVVGILVASIRSVRSLPSPREGVTPTLSHPSRQLSLSVRRWSSDGSGSASVEILPMKQ